MTTQKVKLMDAVKNLDKLTDDVIDNQKTLIITRPDNQNVVMISEVEYQSWKESLYVLGNDANLKFLKESLEQLKNNQIKSFSEEEWKKIRGSTH